MLNQKVYKDENSRLYKVIGKLSRRYLKMNFKKIVNSECQLNKCWAKLKGGRSNLEVTTVTYLPQDL